MKTYSWLNQNRFLSHLRFAGAGTLLSTAAMVILALSAPIPAPAATFVETASEPFGMFGELEYIRHTGRFVGTTALGAYRMAFEIVAPADPGLGNGTVLIEPSHFVFGPAGRDLVFGQAFVFGHGFSHATVGFGTVGLNILTSRRPTSFWPANRWGTSAPVR